MSRGSAFVEKIWFHPSGAEKLLSAALLPLGMLYGSAMALRRRLVKRRRFPVPVVSVGNLLVGGSGKTPTVIALASRYPDAAVVSRGYGRKSRGLRVVSEGGVLRCDVEESGDEAMLMARSLSEASVIVSEDRSAGIEKAIELGAKIVFLDDGFNRVEIEKFEILLEPASVPNRRVMPAGPFREFPSTASQADLLLKEGRDFRRIVKVEHPTEAMLLATSIARPERLEPWLPAGVVGRVALSDHAWFDEEQLRRQMERCGARSLLVTEKDAVKMEGFKLPLSLLRLELEFSSALFDAVESYRKEFYAS